MTVHNDTLCTELHHHFFGHLNAFNDSIRYRRQDSNDSSHDVITTPLSDFREDDDSAKQPLLEFAKYYLAGVVNPALCAFGLIGNVFNVIVLTRKQIKATLECSMELAAHTGLIALAVSDMLYCTSTLLDALVHRDQTVFDRFSPGLYVQMYAYYMQNVFLHTGTWLTVIMAVGRYAAICRPLQARHLIGVRPTRIAVVTTFIVWIILDLPKIWTFQVVPVDCATTSSAVVDVGTTLPTMISYYVLDRGPLVEHRDVKTALAYVWATVGCFVPVVTLSYCNIHLILALRESIRVRRLYRVNPHATSLGSRISPTLVAIVCMYLVLITPAELLHFYYYAVGTDTVELVTTAIVLTNVMQTLNFAFNFVLYCIVNVHFRRTCVDLFVRMCSPAEGNCCCCYYCLCCCRGHCARPAQSHSVLKTSTGHKGRRRSSGVLRRSWHSSSAGSYCTREYLMTHGGGGPLTTAGSSACETVL